MLIRVSLAFAFAITLVPATALAQSVYVVNSAGDATDSSLGNGACDTGETISGGAAECTLRAAIQESNADGAISTINFSIPGEGVHTIMPASPYPDISQAVTIDASTQPGYAGSPLIELDGTNAGAGATGLVVVGGNSVIRALAINSFNLSGLLLVTGGANLVVGNHLGMDASGLNDKGNHINGLTIIDSSHNVIGGIAVADRNVMSGNLENGLAILNQSSTDNQVIGNYIGTDATGQGLSPVVGNRSSGLLISAVVGETEYASDNIIGGEGVGEGNLISNNGTNGVFIFRSDRNRLQGNIIGLNHDGELAAANALNGIQIEDGADNQVGHSIVGGGNVISGNTHEGIVIGGALATGNVIEANFIGTNLTGSIRMANGGVGVLLTSFGAGLPSTGTVIGSIEPGFGNVISGNSEDGVQIAARSSGNFIIGNYIGLAADGQTAIGNQRHGVSVFDSDDNIIGGIADGAENIISGNFKIGVIFSDGFLALGSSNNTVEGNIIGLGADGVTEVGNINNGIYILRSSNNVIGGSDINSGNTISGNGGIGVSVVRDLTGLPAESNRIQGNVIGLEQLALTSKPNKDAGVFVRNARDTIIGGALLQEANIIAGNKLTGVEILGDKVTSGEQSSGIVMRTIVQGNYIGTNPAGDDLLGNDSYGVLIKNARNNEIGGTGEGEGNTIAFNGESHEQRGHGVVVDGGNGNAIRRNSIFKNHGRGISLVDPRFPLSVPYAFNIPDASEDMNGNLSVDTNEDFKGNNNNRQDFGDSDTGSNELQNYPLVTHVEFGQSTKIIEWTLYGPPGPLADKISVDLFANDEADPSGFGEGRRFIKTIEVNTNAHGHAVFEEEFNLEMVNGKLIGPLVSATATDGSSNTSEFSMIDTDGDSIADQWEINGIDIDEDGVRDYPAPHDSVPMSDFLHKDVFVEADSIASTIRFPGLKLAIFAPTVQEQNDLVSAFATVPNEFVHNPEGNVGVVLHLDVDETIPHHQWLGDADNDGIPDDDGWKFFYKIKNSGTLLPVGGFGTFLERFNRKTIAAKRLFYRYAIFADTIGETDKTTMLQAPSTTLGIGEATRGIGEPNDPYFVDGGNDFFVSMGSLDQPGGTVEEKTSTFMHELGHTLGLMHGGANHDLYKPNYHSIMNYLWVDRNVNFPEGWSLDFSRERFDEIDEAAVKEAAGFGGNPSFRVPFGPPGFNGTQVLWTFDIGPEGGPVDLNGDGSENETLPWDLNNWGKYDLSVPPDGIIDETDIQLRKLKSRADWSTLRFNFLGTPSTANAAFIEGDDVEEPTREILNEIEAVGEETGELAFAVSLAEVDEDAGIVRIDVRRIAGTVGAVSVDFETIDDSAIAGLDYVFSSGTIDFADRQIRQSIEIEILDDADQEPNEVLQIQLSNPLGGASLGSDVFYLGIRANDGPGELQFLNPFYDEQEDAGIATIAVERIGGTAGAVSVDFETSDSLALGDEDYTSSFGTLNFADGVSRQTFTVSLTEDVLIEGNEGLVLSLSNPTGGAGLGIIDEAYLTILNVPTTGPTFNFSEAHYQIDESIGGVDGLLTVEVIRSGVIDVEASVDLTTVDGTATAGEDYTSTSVSLTFLAGEVSKTVDVSTTRDALLEGVERFYIRLLNPSVDAFVGEAGETEVRILDPRSLTVTNTNDIGPGSLRQAIFDANSLDGLSIIDFNIPGPGVHTIRPQSPLRAITQPVIIDGYTQTGASPNTQEEGSDAVLMIELDGSEAGAAYGLIIQASDVVIRGLVINRFQASRVHASLSNNVVIEGNFLGPDSSGTTRVFSQDGLDEENGVEFHEVTNSRIGGTSAASRNIISGNDNHGVLMRDAQDGNRVLGNLIGVGADGSALGNGLAENSFGFSGILVGSNDSGIVVIGGTDPLSGNVIAHNWQGVAVGLSNTHVKIRGNSMFENQNIGINLGGGNEVIGSVVNRNDLGDGDTGGNGSQNYPVLGSVQSVGGETTIGGYLSSTASNGFTLDFYASPTIHITGYGEGKTWLGSAEVSTDANGHANFEIVLSVDLAEGIAVTATATDSLGRTSEFSQRQAVGAVLSENLVVTSAGDGDDGFCDTAHCTLREALRAANNYPGINTINFDINGAGAHTISPTFRLPTITEAVLIDGYTQPGASPNSLGQGSNAVLKIEIEGSQMAPSPLNINWVDGLEVMDTGTTIRGLAINRFLGDSHDNGIRIRGDGNRVEGCFIGTDVTGTVALNNFTGIDIFNGDSNIIGGTNPAQRNLVSGNWGGIHTGVGISVNGDNNVILGNLIGTDITGLGAFIQQGVGVFIAGSGASNILGGSEPGAANVISGNKTGANASGDGLIIKGNLIGTDATGLKPLGNQIEGLRVGGGTIQVGGVGANDGNVISGNVSQGMTMGQSNRLRVVQGNLIGTDRSGTLPLGNGGDGIYLGGLSLGQGISLVGGDTAGAPNIIAYNAGAGVNVNVTEATISANTIFSNGGLGIDLGDDGVTVNDAGDGDVGANNLQNFPEIDSVIIGGGLTTISGRLSSMADTTYRLEFYVNEFVDASGHGESSIFLGSTDTLTDNGGEAVFEIEFAGELSLQQSVTATAADPAGNTSEFSLGRAVGRADIAVTQAASSDPFIFGDDVTFTATVSNLGPDAAHGVSLTNALPPDTTFVSAVPAQGDCVLLSTTVLCTIGSIAAAANAEVDITINRTAEYGLENTVTVFSNQTDPETDNNTHSLEIGVLKSADLALSKAADPLTVPDGETVTYTLSLINNGPSKDFNFELIDVLPAGLTPVSANSDIGGCLIDDNTVSCNGLIDTLGQSFDVSIAADVSGDGPVTNTAGLSSDVLDRKPENNTASVDITIIPAADLQLTQFDTPDPVAAGETLIYTLNISSGTGEATGVELVDTLPTGVIFGSAIASQGSCIEDAGVVTCDIGDMAASENATVSIEVMAGAGGVFLTNTAVVSALSPADPDLENNSSTEGTYVSAKCTPTLFGSGHSGDFGPSTFYQINPQDGAASVVGDIGFERVGAMDFDPVSGQLFAAGERSDFSDIPVLLTIDPETGAGEELGPMAVSKPVRDIAFRHSDGVLYGYAGRSEIYTFNTTTGEQTLIGPAESGSGNSLTFSPADILYNAGVEIFTIDQATGSATHILDLVFSPPADSFPRLSGMDFDPSTGTYYVIVKDGFTGSPETYLGTLDVQTGVVSIIGQTEGSMDGLAVQCFTRGGGIFSDSFEDRGE